uniref:Membrane transporter protein n=1 Tax=Haemonchus contortus TaxID=6289 RepID=W6NGR2_HAECO
MPVIMLLGSTVAGMTAEGGGAIAFPFMTLCLQIDPVSARDFSLMIQSFGMGCALFAVLYMRIQIEEKSLLFGCLGSIPGMILGLAYVDDLLGASEKKMLFVSIWCSFAIALYLLNSEKKRITYSKIPDFKLWKALVLIATGFVGGIFTSFAGSGVDICIFSMNTLLFRVSEKTATPTTVVMMGLNSMIGLYCRAVWYANVSELTYEYLKVTIPVAVTMAPVGSFLGSHFHRQVLACFVYILEALSLLGFLITGPPIFLVVLGAGIIVVAFFFFYVISKFGEMLMPDGGRARTDSTA